MAESKDLTDLVRAVLPGCVVTSVQVTPRVETHRVETYSTWRLYPGLSSISITVEMEVVSRDLTEEVIPDAWDNIDRTVQEATDSEWVDL